MEGRLLKSTVEGLEGEFTFFAAKVFQSLTHSSSKEAGSVMGLLRERVVRGALDLSTPQRLSRGNHHRTSLCPFFLYLDLYPICQPSGGKINVNLMLGLERSALGLFTSRFREHRDRFTIEANAKR